MKNMKTYTKASVLTELNKLIGLQLQTDWTLHTKYSLLRLSYFFITSPLVSSLSLSSNLTLSSITPFTFVSFIQQNHYLFSLFYPSMEFCIPKMTYSNDNAKMTK